MRFVNLVSAKTPKVTLYSDKAKSHLMENLPNPDFETCFYDGEYNSSASVSNEVSSRLISYWFSFIFLPNSGGKISRTNEGVRLIDQDGRNNLIVSQEHAQSLSRAPRMLWDHFLQVV